MQSVRNFLSVRRVLREAFSGLRVVSISGKCSHQARVAKFCIVANSKSPKEYLLYANWSVLK